MRSKKLVAVLTGTALLGVTSLGGVAAAEAAKPVAKPVGSAAPSTHDERHEQAASAPAAGADARARALTEMRALIENGVPGADPQSDARLKQALVTAEKAMASVRGHTTAQNYTHSWALAVKPAFPWAAGGTAEAAPDAKADLPPLPDLDGLLEAAKSLDLGTVLESLTKLLDGVLSTLTGTVSGITQSLSGITADAGTQLPDVPEVQMPDIPEIKLPEIKMPEFTMPEFTFPDIKMPAFRTPGMPKVTIQQMPAFRELPGRPTGR